MKLKHAASIGHQAVAAPEVRGRERPTNVAALNPLESLLFGVPYLAFATAFLSFGPTGHPLAPFPAVVAIVLLLAAGQLELPLRKGWASALQLPFVVMVFAMPLNVVPVVVVACQVVSGIVKRRPLGRLPLFVADSWFIAVPIAVLALWAPGAARWTQWPIYAVAFVAGFAADLAIGAARRALTGDRTGVLGALTPVAIDVMLTPVGIMAAVEARSAPAGMAAALFGVLGLLGLLSYERNGRIAEQRRALHDPLTGLANRALFAELLAASEERCRRDGLQGAVLLIDVDDFKLINDSYGHLVGDEVLCQFAGRIVGQVRSADTAARLGGDEFAIILTEPSGVAAARVVAEKIRKAVSDPMRLSSGDTLTVGGSIGAAAFDRDTATATAMAHADADLYADKRGKPARRH